MHTTTASHIIPAQPPPTRFAPRCTKRVQSAILAGLLSLAFLSTATAADFSGSLKGVTITDAQAANKPPVAAFTYKQEGETLTLEASGSSDPDGSISKYKWDFGDGQMAEGLTTTYTLTSIANVQVTLTVVDNNNGVAMGQQKVITTSKGIRDDFSADSSNNYTVMTGNALSVYDGALHTETRNTTVAYHNSSLGSNDHFIEADVTYVPEDGTGLLARCDREQKTGYLVYFESGRLFLKSYSNGQVNTLAQHIGNYIQSTYKIKLEVVGNTITVFVNGNPVIIKNDTTYTNGTYAGVRLRVGGDAKLITLDNLIGE